MSGGRRRSTCCLTREYNGSFANYPPALEQQQLDGGHDLGPGVLEPPEHGDQPAEQHQRAASDRLPGAPVQLVRPRPERADQVLWRGLADPPLGRPTEHHARRPPRRVLERPSPERAPALRPALPAGLHLRERHREHLLGRLRGHRSPSRSPGVQLLRELRADRRRHLAEPVRQTPSARRRARSNRPACASRPTTAGTTSRPTTTRTSPTGASPTTTSASRASGTTTTRRAGPRRTSARRGLSRARPQTCRPSSTTRTRRT